MSRSKKLTNDIQELPQSPAAAASIKIIEWDPSKSSAQQRSAKAKAQMQVSADTVIPSDDLFRARDELQARMGGRQARISAFAAAATDCSGMENVVGYGVGFKYTANCLAGNLAAKVYVREKLPLAQVSDSAKVPEYINGTPTDVEAIGEVRLHSYAKRYPRPVPCGVSISNINLRGSGTLGCLVVLENGKLCILSNNHVLADENAAQIGDDIIQPGNAEPSPAPDQKIGELENFVPIAATGNVVDAAVAWTNRSLVSPAHITYAVNPTPLAATLGMTVLKNGRTTQSTLGIVTEVGVNISVAYDPFPAGAEMTNQIGIRGVSGPFSMPGDSGSLIVTVNSKQPVALLFAGSNDNSMTFANPFDAVMAALGIDHVLGP